MKTKRLLIALRNARKTFFSTISDAPENHRTFKKKAPYKSPCNCVELTERERNQLTPKEKIFTLEKAIHDIRLSIMDNEGESRGRLTREQSYMLCIFKKEMDELKAGEVY
jgi:hypothetical protein